MLPPNRAYYRTCQGSWRAPLAFTSTLSGLLAMPRWLGFAMDTTVDYDSRAASGEVVHTTLIRWRFVPLTRSVEIFTLDDNGRDFTLIGRLLWAGGPVLFGGGGRVDEDGRGASYTFELSWLMLWTVLRQQTRWDGQKLTITQEHRLFTGVQHLRRRGAAPA